MGQILEGCLITGIQTNASVYSGVLSLGGVTANFAGANGLDFVTNSYYFKIRSVAFVSVNGSAQNKIMAVLETNATPYVPEFPETLQLTYGGVAISQNKSFVQFYNESTTEYLYATHTTDPPVNPNERYIDVINEWNNVTKEFTPKSSGVFLISCHRSYGDIDIVIKKNGFDFFSNWITSKSQTYAISLVKGDSVRLRATSDDPIIIQIIQIY